MPSLIRHSSCSSDVAPNVYLIRARGWYEQKREAMKRILVPSGVVLSALLIGAVLEGRWEDTQVNLRAKEDSDREPKYLHLPVWYAMKEGNKKARVGYWDTRKKMFHAWKGILVPVAEIPGMADLNARAQPLDLTKIHVIEIDPPVFYLQRADDSFVPGYCSRWSDATIFYEWKGVTLTRPQIPDTAAKKRLLRKADVGANRPIEPPQHRLRESKDWKKE